MTLEELFTSLYTSLNGKYIRRTADGYFPDAGSPETAEEIVSLCRQSGMESELKSFPAADLSEGPLTAVCLKLPGRASGIFYVIASCSGEEGAVLLETALALRKLMERGSLPQLEETLCFLWGTSPSFGQNFLHCEAARRASGSVLLSICSDPEMEEGKEKFILHRSSDIQISALSALGTKAVELLSQISGIEYETKALPFEKARFRGGQAGLCTFSGGALSPGALKGNAVFAAFLACAGAAGKNELARLCCEDWKKLCRAKCLEALQLKEDSFESRMLRGIRLSAWRDLALKNASVLGENETFREFSEFLQEKTEAALQLLCGGEMPRFKSDANQEIVELFSDSPETCFDSRRTVFETARDLWASRPYGEKESWDELDEEISYCADAAEKIVRNGQGRYKEADCVTIETLKNTLRELGVSPGDTLMVHSSYKSFGSFEEGPQGVIRALQESVTESGILAMPGFSDCCDGGSGGVFDREHTPVEKKVGIIPEFFRQSKGVLRSSHPTHSLCAWGREAQAFLSQENPFDCFAPDGPWGRIAESGKILFLGDVIDSNTFLHACEAWYTSSLDSTQAEVDGRMVNIINYPGGCRGNWYGKKEQAPYFVKLLEKNIIRKARAGNAPATLMKGALLALAMKEIFQENPGCLLHRSNCRECARRRSLLKSEI